MQSQMWTFWQEEGLFEIPSLDWGISVYPHTAICNALGLKTLNHAVILKPFTSDSLLPTAVFTVILFIICSIEYLENIQQLLTAIVKKVPLIAEKSKQ